jgi:hypothetical protein
MKIIYMSELDILFKTKYLPNDVTNRCRCSKPAIPLSKRSIGLNTSNNNTQISNSMRYSQIVRNYGTQQSTSSASIKTNSLGGPTFSY